MSYSDGPFKAIAKQIYWAAQDGVCLLCGHGMRQRVRTPKLTFDHVWPRSRHTLDNDIGNLMLVHDTCNAGKADRKPRGCEILALFAINRRIGLRQNITSRWENPA